MARQVESFDLGPDSPSYPRTDKEIKWVVTYYIYDGNDGSGYGVFMTEGGDLYESDLGHCSCYSPWEDNNNNDNYTAIPDIQQWLKDVDSALCNKNERPVKEKVMELLNIVPLKG